MPTPTARPEPPRSLGGRSPLLAVLVVPVVAITAVLATRVVAGPATGSSTAAARSADAVVIRDFAFGPPSLAVSKGTRLTVRNEDGTLHTLTARNGSFDTGALEAGTTGTVVLNQPGTFEYRCEIHTSMTGKLVVT